MNCEACGAEVRVVSGKDGANYYVPVYNEEVYDSLKEMLHWFGAYPEIIPDWDEKVQRKMDVAIQRAKEVVSRVAEARV
jgi:hypothetical protein